MNAKKSYRPYLNEDEGFGLYIWIDLSKKPFYKWPYLLDYAEESDRKDIEREHKSISVYTKIVKPGVSTCIDCIERYCFIITNPRA